MRYEEPKAVGRNELERAQAAGDVDWICSALIGLVFHDDDRKWLQDTCLSLLRHRTPEVRRCAATGLGHVARIHRALDTDVVVSALETMRDDPEAAGAADDALEDIAMFVA